MRHSPHPFFLTSIIQRPAGWIRRDVRTNYRIIPITAEQVNGDVSSVGHVIMLCFLKGLNETILIIVYLHV